MAGKAPFAASADEIACSLLLQVLQEIASPLGDFVQRRMMCVYGAEKWLTVAREAFPKFSKMRGYPGNWPDGKLRDMYVICELLMAQLDQVFISQAKDVDHVHRHALLLSKIARELQGVAQTRTWVFHSFVVSANEVHRCLECIQQIWRRFSLSGQDKLKTTSEVSKLNFRKTENSKSIPRKVFFWSVVASKTNDVVEAMWISMFMYYAS